MSGRISASATLGVLAAALALAGSASLGNAASAAADSAPVVRLALPAGELALGPERLDALANKPFGESLRKRKPQIRPLLLDRGELSPDHRGFKPAADGFGEVSDDD